MIAVAIALAVLLALQITYDRRLRREIARRGEIAKQAYIGRQAAIYRAEFWEDEARRNQRAAERLARRVDPHHPTAALSRAYSEVKSS